MKTVEESARARGYDAHKCVKSRKRHLLAGTLGRNRRLAKAYERMVQTSETLIELVVIRLLLRRLALYLASAAQPGGRSLEVHKREGIMRPTIVLLIGTSSAGKSTLAKRLQDALSEPYLLLGIDDVFRMVPERWGGGLDGPLSAVGFRYDRTSEQGMVTIRYGAVGEAILKGMHRAVAAFAEAGNNLIVDEMLLDERVLIDWIEQLGRFLPYLVQVTATEASLERRERERQRGCVPGLARGHLRVNDLRHWDFLIDTTDQQPDVYTQVLSHWIGTRPRATAVGKYRRDFGLL